MEQLAQYLVIPSAWAKAHLSTISAAFTTTALAIFGDDINRAVKNRIAGRSFLVRTTAFIALCAAGYGALSVVVAPAVALLLLAFGEQYLALTAGGAFVVVGILAERKRYT